MSIKYSINPTGIIADFPVWLPILKKEIAYEEIASLCIVNAVHTMPGGSTSVQIPLGTKDEVKNFIQSPWITLLSGLPPKFQHGMTSLELQYASQGTQLYGFVFNAQAFEALLQYYNGQIYIEKTVYERFQLEFNRAFEYLSISKDRISILPDEQEGLKGTCL